MKRLFKIMISFMLSLSMMPTVFATDYSAYYETWEEVWGEDEAQYYDGDIQFNYKVIDSDEEVLKKEVGDTINLYLYNLEDEDDYIKWTGTITDIDYYPAGCTDNAAYDYTFEITIDNYKGIAITYVQVEDTATGVHSAYYGDFKDVLTSLGYEDTDWDAINAYLDGSMDDDGNYIVYICCAYCHELLTTVSTTKVETVYHEDYDYTSYVYYFTYYGKEYTEEYEYAFNTSSSLTSASVSLSSLNLDSAVKSASVSDQAVFTVSVNSDGNLVVTMKDDVASGKYKEDVTLTLADGSTIVITLTVVYDESEGITNVTYEESTDSDSETNGSTSSDSVETADTDMIMVYSVLGLAALAGVIYTEKKEHIL